MGALRVFALVTFVILLHGNVDASFFDGPGVFMNNGTFNNTIADFRWADYTLRVVREPKHFETFEAPLVFVNDYDECNGIAHCMLDACRFGNVPRDQFVGSIVVLTTSRCELASAMMKVG
jgi:hypothetical protein